MGGVGGSSRPAYSRTMADRFNPLTQLTLDQLRERSSAKWRRYDPDVLPLWVAEIDVPLAPAIEEALLRAVRDGDTGYPGDTPYVEAFSSFASDMWGWTVAHDDVRPVSSVIAGYVDAVLEVTDAGGHFVVTPPVYPPFYSYLQQVDRQVLEAPLDADLRLDMAALETAFETATAGNRRAAFLLCNPHNPGGVVHTRAELEAVAALASRYGVTVVADEIHAPIVYDEATFVPYLSVDPTGMALHAASKAWNLAGIPAALHVFGTAATAVRDSYKAGAHHWPTLFGVIAQTAAYRDSREWLDDLLVGLDANRRLVADLVAEQLPGARFHMPSSTYLTWIDCRDLGLGDDPAEAFLERGRVALNSGPTFGTGGAGHARLNIGTSPAILEEAVRRMAATVA